MSSAHSHHEHRHADAPHNPSHQAAVPAVPAVPAELLNSVADWTSTFKVMSDPTRTGREIRYALHHDEVHRILHFIGAEHGEHHHD